jgi:hypothetical protein
VKDDGGHAGRLLGEPGLDPVRRARALHARIDFLRDFERRPKPLVAVQLIGPDVRGERQAALIAQWIEWPQVATRPRRYLHRSV